MRLATQRLTPAQLEAYRQDGVLFPVPVLTADEVARYRACLEELEARVGGQPKPSDMSQPQLHFRWAAELSTHPAVLDVIEDVLGPDILVHSASIFSKPPRSRGYVSWHQDGAYWGLSEPGVTSAWIALSESTPENGCLRVVPGSHTRRVLPFTETRGAADNLLASGMEVAVEVDESEAVDVALRAGEMSLHHSNIIHGSRPNRSTGRRTGFIVRFVTPALPASDRPVLRVRGGGDLSHLPQAGEQRPPAEVDAGLAVWSTRL